MTKETSSRNQPIALTTCEERLPLISVVSAVLNAATCLESALQSVFSQSYKNIEVIVIDGGSCDGTVDIIKKFEDRIRFWVSESDKGIYDALNKGILNTSGEWVYFLGADDVLADNDVFSKIFCREYSSNLIYGDVFFGDGSLVYGGKFTKRRLLKHNICHQAIFYRRDLFKDLGLFDLKYPLLADWAFNMSAYGRPSTNPEHIDTLIARFSLNGASSILTDHTFGKDRLDLIRKHFGLPYFILAKLLNFKDKVETAVRTYFSTADNPA